MKKEEVAKKFVLWICRHLRDEWSQWRLDRKDELFFLRRKGMVVSRDPYHHLADYRQSLAQEINSLRVE